MSQGTVDSKGPYKREGLCRGRNLFWYHSQLHTLEAQTFDALQQGNYKAELRIPPGENENNEVYVEYKPKPINSATPLHRV